MAGIPESFREFGPVMSGTLPGGPVAVCWCDGEFYAVRPLEWPEAARMLRELAGAPDSQASETEPWDSVIEQFIMDSDIHAESGPLPAAGVYAEYLRWHEENPPTPAPLAEPAFREQMARACFHVVGGRFGDFYVESFTGTSELRLETMAA